MRIYGGWCKVGDTRGYGMMGYSMVWEQRIRGDMVWWDVEKSGKEVNIGSKSTICGPPYMMHLSA